MLYVLKLATKFIKYKIKLKIEKRMIRDGNKFSLSLLKNITI
jgi:hypothetical protein